MIRSHAGVKGSTFMRKWEFPSAGGYLSRPLRATLPHSTIQPQRFSLKMSIAEERSFYEETHEATSKEEKLMEASFDDERYVVRRMSFEESFETFGAIPSVEEPIEASFFEGNFASPKENKSKWERLLYEVSINFRPFVVIGEIKERFAKKLNQQGIPVKEFGDFNLGVMGVLNGLDKGDYIIVLCCGSPRLCM